MAKSKLPRGMYLRGNVYYSRIAGADGRLIRKPLSIDKSTAILMLNEMRKSVELQRAGIAPIEIQKEIRTFEELKARYLEHLKARALSLSAFEAFRYGYKRVILKCGFVYLQDMTLAKVEELARRLAKEGVSGQTINYYVGQIQCALRWAHENGYIRRNALANWCNVRKNEPRFRRDFQPAEVARLFEAETDPEWRLRWLVYFNTGFRLSAGLGLCWEWIDWEQRLLRLPLEENKSRRRHEIPLSQGLFDALLARKQELGSPTGEVFSSVPGYAVRTRLTKICRAAGIDPKGICVHSIRHTVATTIFNNTKGNLKAVQEILGHSDPSTTMRYLHVTGEEKRRAMDALNFNFTERN